MGEPPHRAHSVWLHVGGDTGVHDKGLLQHYGGQPGYTHIYVELMQLD